MFFVMGLLHLSVKNRGRGENHSAIYTKALYLASVALSRFFVKKRHESGENTPLSFLFYALRADLSFFSSFLPPCLDFACRICYNTFSRKRLLARKPQKGVFLYEGSAFLHQKPH
jgi:hypothetical protein